MYKVGDKLKCSFDISGVCKFTNNSIYEIATQRQQDKKYVIFDDNNQPSYFDKDELGYFEIVNDFQSLNNGGSTDYYKFKENWKECADIIEDREMNYNQGNIFKSAFCFNIGRHNATDYTRELNKIIYFANRELERIKNANR